MARWMVVVSHSFFLAWLIDCDFGETAVFDH